MTNFEWKLTDRSVFMSNHLHCIALHGLSKVSKHHNCFALRSLANMYKGSLTLSGFPGRQLYVASFFFLVCLHASPFNWPGTIYCLNHCRDDDLSTTMIIDTLEFFLSWCNRTWWREHKGHTVMSVIFKTIDQYIDKQHHWKCWKDVMISRPGTGCLSSRG